MTITCRVEAKVTDFENAPLFGIEHNGHDHTNEAIMFPYFNQTVVFSLNGDVRREPKSHVFSARRGYADVRG